MSPKFSANLSMLYTEVPFLERFEKASQAGFAAVEFLFPYEAGVEVIRTITNDLGLTIALFNLHPGDTEVGEWGTLSHPMRRDYFKWSFSTAIEAAQHLQCKRLNMMFGQRVEQQNFNDHIDCACENLLWAAPMASEAGVDLLLEPLNPTDFPDYALNQTGTAVQIIQRVNHPRVKLQYDVYHAQMTEGNLIATIKSHFEHIRHLQIADVPGRHQPGTGEINFPMIFTSLQEMNYNGYVGLEYHPSIETDQSLEWLPIEDRGYVNQRGSKNE